MKRTIHEGSVSYSVTIPNPAPGQGKHAKTPEQKLRRHYFNRLRRTVDRGMASVITAIYRNKGRF